MSRIRINCVAAALLLPLALTACNASSTGSSKSSAAPSTASSAPSAPSSAKSSDAAQNVTVTDCKVDNLGGTNLANLGYTVNNPTSKSSNYLIEIDIIDSTKAKVGSANAYEQNVLPGRPSQGQAVGNVSSSAVAPYTCVVGKVSRNAAP